MGNFTVRVELHKNRIYHDLDHKDYDTLHAQMEQEGFSRTIKAESGTIYHLPRAEYSIITNLDKWQVRDKAMVAVEKTGQEYEILVSGCDYRVFTNLRPVKS